MPQPDFAMLAIQHSLAEDAPHFHGEREYIASLNIEPKNDDKASSDVDAPVNFIPKELSEFIAAPIVTETSLVDRMDLDEIPVPIMDDMFEPLRTLRGFAPPKRFYRTFWRSASRRMLALSENQMT